MKSVCASEFWRYQSHYWRAVKASTIEVIRYGTVEALLVSLERAKAMEVDLSAAPRSPIADFKWVDFYESDENAHVITRYRRDSYAIVKL